MTESGSAPPPHERRLERVKARYLEASRTGADPEAIIAANPDLANDLRAIFSDHDAIRRLAPSLTEDARSFGYDREEGPVVPEPTPGSPVAFGRHELLEEIGRGGMGIVYRARQRGLNRIVALKRMIAGGWASVAEVRRFGAEAEAGARLDHPNIVQVYEVDEHQGLPYFTMRLMEGGSLADRLPGLESDPRAGAKLMAEVARAIHHAHQRGILHRDLKPSNILLDEAGLPHVADFGLASPLGGGVLGLTLTGVPIGSPPYMAPEQAEGRSEAITTATDVYGLGAVLYATLTGRPPFGGGTVVETLDRLRHDAPTPPHELNPRVDRDLETICLRCLEKEPRRRYGSAAEVADDLDRFLRGEPVSARPVGRAERLWRWCRRNRAVSSLAATVALLTASAMVALSIGVLALGRQKGRTEAELHAKQELADRLVRQSDTLERQLYASRVNRALAEWSAGEVGTAEGLLEASPPARRGWEWGFVRRLGSLDRATFADHKLPVLAMAFSPDGSRLATLGHSIDRERPPSELLVRDVMKGSLVTEERPDGTCTLAFHPDGTRVALGGSDGRILIRDMATRGRLATLEGPRFAVSGLAFSRDGSRIAASFAGSVAGGAAVWDLGAKQPSPARPLGKDTGPVYAVAFDPVSDLIATGHKDATVHLWDPSRGAELRVLKGHDGPVYTLAFSPDGSRMASGSWDQSVTVWSPQDGRRMLTMHGHTSFVRAIAFSPDGRRIASAGEDKFVRTWEAETGRRLNEYRGHRQPVLAVAFSPDGKILASAGQDARVKFWDPDSDSASIALRHGDWVGRVAFCPGRMLLATASRDKRARVWDATSGRSVWDLEGHEAEVSSLAFHPGGRILATGGWDGKVRLWDVDTGRPIRVLGTGTRVNDVCFNPGGTLLAVCGWDGSIGLWDIDEGKELRRFRIHPDFAIAAVFRPDGRAIASAAPEGGARIWDPVDGRELVRVRGIPTTDRGGRQNTLAFSPDGLHLAVCEGPDSAAPGIARIWDVSGNVPVSILDLSGHASGLTSLAYSPDGARLLTSSYDGTIRSWDSVSGDEIIALRGHVSGVLSVAFSPDGLRAASGGIDKIARIWDATPPETTRPGR